MGIKGVPSNPDVQHWGSHHKMVSHKLNRRKGDTGRLGEEVWVWHTLLSTCGGKILTCPRAWGRQILTRYNKIRFIHSQEIRSRNANEGIINYLGKWDWGDGVERRESHPSKSVMSLSLDILKECEVFSLGCNVS